MILFTVTTLLHRTDTNDDLKEFQTCPRMMFTERNLSLF